MKADKLRSLRLALSPPCSLFPETTLASLIFEAGVFSTEWLFLIGGLRVEVLRSDSRIALTPDGRVLAERRADVFNSLLPLLSLLVDWMVCSWPKNIEKE